MPNLLNVNNYHYRRGGSDVVYFEHAELMRKAGFNNAFFAMRHDSNYPCEWDRFFVDEINYESQGTIYEKMFNASKVIYSFEANKKLNSLLNIFDADIAHLHCIYHHISPSILKVLGERGIPVVMTTHDLKIACPAYKMLNSDGVCERCKDGNFLNLLKHRCIKNSRLASSVVMLESMLHRTLGTYLNGVDYFISPSRFFINKFSEWRINAEKFVYIPNYVDSSIFEPEFNPGKYFIYFGRLAEEKGVATLIAAAAKAQVCLKIVGTGPIEDELKKFSLGINANVDFLGYKTGAELHSIIRGARAVVLPSEWYENSPMSVLESFALGKPVIAADIGGIPELVLNDVSGWLFESGNDKELSEVLSMVARLPNEDIRLLGTSARDFVANNFNVNRYRSLIFDLYSKLGVHF